MDCRHSRALPHDVPLYLEDGELPSAGPPLGLRHEPRQLAVLDVAVGLAGLSLRPEAVVEVILRANRRDRSSSIGRVKGRVPTGFSSARLKCTPLR